MSKHTPRRWKLENRTITNPEGVIICFAGQSKKHGYSISLEEAEANAQRIVACVNGCEGINPEAVPKMMAALESIANGVDYSTVGYVAESAIAKAKETPC